MEQAQKLAVLDRVAERFGPSELVDELRRRLRQELEQEQATRPAADRRLRQRHA